MKACSKCESEKLIFGADPTDGNAAKITITVQKNPSAFLLKGKVDAPFSGIICGECGYIEFYVNNPAVLYAAYRKSSGGE